MLVFAALAIDSALELIHLQPLAELAGQLKLSEELVVEH